MFADVVFLDVNSLSPNSFFWFRFSYIAICCLSILRCLDKINVEKAVNYILSCKNLDGGFGCTPGGESHAGQSMLIGQYEYVYILTYIFILGIVNFLVLGSFFHELKLKLC